MREKQKYHEKNCVLMGCNGLKWEDKGKIMERSWDTNEISWDLPSGYLT